MPSPRPHFCRICGRHFSEAGTISVRGKCAGCGDERIVANHEQLRAHDGPFFDHWRRKMLAAFGVTVVDEPDETR